MVEALLRCSTVSRQHTTFLVGAVMLALFAAGCGKPPLPSDAGSGGEAANANFGPAAIDAGAGDAGPADGGVDAGPADAGRLRAGPLVQVGTNLTGLTGADFDGDGKLDLAFTGQFRLGLLCGKGDGTFAPAVAQAASPSAREVVSADFDLDGRPDVALLGGAAGANTIDVFRGTAAGFTAAGSSGSTGTFATALSMAELNSDGKVDLVIVENTPSGMLRAFLGQGDGTFTTATPTSMGGTFFILAMGDLSGDGKVDAVAIPNSADGYAVALGAGDGSFGAPSLHSTYPWKAGAAALADFDGDGELDLALAVKSTTGGALLVCRGQGYGTFATGVTYPGLTDPKAVVAADLDGDGRLDLVVSSGNAVALFTGEAHGTFVLEREYPLGLSPDRLVVGDFNGDQRLDVATWARFGAVLQILSGRP